MLQALIEYIMPPPGSSQLGQFVKPPQPTHEHCLRSVLTVLLVSKTKKQPEQQIFRMIAEHLWETRHSLRWLPLDILVTGDDFGYSKERNKGLVLALQHASVDRVSLLVNHEATEDAVALWKRHRFAMGLHWNLSEGKSLTNPRSFTDDNGYFLGKQGFWSAAGQASGDEIRVELEAQLDLFCALTGGVPPSHLDGHQHVHAAPRVSRQVLQIYRKRSMHDTPLRVPEEGGAMPSEFLQRVSTLARTSLGPMVEREGISRVRRFLGCRTMGAEMTRANVCGGLLEIVEEEESTPQVELMCHPGYPGVSGDLFNRSQERLSELRFLLRYF